MRRLIQWAERGLLPDFLLRYGIRQLLRGRLAEVRKGNRFESSLTAPIAVETEAANRQHYELPPAFFERVLGPRLKYSSALWPTGVTTLADAEEAMLRLTCRRAVLQNQMRILELGCGWGSLTLWMATRYPYSRITAVSNSASQKEYIERVCADQNLENVAVVRCDINDYKPVGRFDRIVTVEMFEHVRNHASLLNRIASWLERDGRLFVHVFTHRQFTYLFEREGSSNWMGRYFFTGGMMLSASYLPALQTPFKLESRWRTSGVHYQKTAAAWLANMEDHASIILELFKTVYPVEPHIWLQRWRLFFMACEELFGYREGSEWGVSHYRFRL